MHKIKVIIADDHPIFRLGLKSIITQHKHIVLCGEAENGIQALELIQEHKPDVAILDIEMPVKNGLQVCETIFLEKINTKILILTFFKEADLFEKAISVGASGYLLKDNATAELIIAIETLFNGNKYLSQALRDKLLSGKSHLINNSKIAEITKTLSSTEKNILLLIAEERSTKEIALELFVTEKTIENHRYNIAKKLNLESGKNTLLKFALANKDYFK